MKLENYLEELESHFPEESLRSHHCLIVRGPQQIKKIYPDKEFEPDEYRNVPVIPTSYFFSSSTPKIDNRNEIIRVVYNQGIFRIDFDEGDYTKVKEMQYGGRPVVAEIKSEDSIEILTNNRLRDFFREEFKIEMSPTRFSCISSEIAREYNLIPIVKVARN